ncbi:MAG: bifunctional alpha,alpha-trehalose-phosphate synthase (UDP-forming)/trehalose-phosphatase, partial [Nanoarchaeota archaeon]|nr:bifunctional alpha,alpha-trehalose-phosphate synthase (UDP-forming)/trehalose-phosphatase [Nanoarchaeota archaeon]
MSNIKNSTKRKILIVSNRLPIDITKKGNKLHIHQNIGGLTTALSSVQKQYQWKWVGWPGRKNISKEIENKFNSEFNCYSVFLSEQDIKKYYLGFCNETLWPLFHYFPKITKYNSSEWDYYTKVNQMFCDKIIEIAGPEDNIWIQDYHLMLLPNLLRKHLPKATIGFFSHIPFPPFEIFRLLPWRKEILMGILGADLIGFHTYEYSNNFLSNVLYLLGNDNELGRLQIGERTINVGVFPLGIDFQKYFGAAKNPEVEKEVRKFRKIVGERKVVLSVDRMDYTKGIPERLEAFSTFLEENRQWHDKIIMIMVVPPSRIEAHQYSLLKKEIDETVGRINGKYSTMGWSPIIYIHKPMSFQSLSALYVISDVALITPLRDGMNLIAKEYIATNSDGLGVLILSEMAGAVKELGEAIIINPNNKKEISQALNIALTMPKEEQILRNKIMQERLRFYDVEWWVKKYLEKIDETKKIQEVLKAKILNHKIQNELIHNYHLSKSRLIFLDYDGTLVP